MEQLRVPWKHPRDAEFPHRPLTKSYLHAASSEPLCGKTLGEILQEASDHLPDHHAFEFPEYNTRQSFKNLFDTSKAVSKSFLALGMKHGDKIFTGTICDVNWLSLYFGAMTVGLVYMKPYLFTPVDEYCRKIINKVDCKAMILSQEDRDMLLSVAPEILTQKWDQLNLNQLTSVKHITVFGDKVGPGVLSFEQFIALGESVTDEEFNAARSLVDVNDTAYILFTSGTTGEPKAVCQSHQTLVHVDHFKRLRRNPENKPLIVMSTGPRYDDFNCVLSAAGTVMSWLTKSVLIFAPEAGDVLSIPRKMVKQIQDSKVTHCDIYPFQWVDIFESEYNGKYDLSSLKGGLIGSIPITETFIRSVIQYLPEFDNLYAMSEMMGIASGFAKDPDIKRRIRTTGYPWPHVEVKIISEEDGHILPICQEGEICARGFCTFNGYYNQPNKTREIKDEHGWIHTGDLGTMDEQGFVIVLGRKEDAIRLKNQFGDVIYPVAVENKVRCHPKIKDCQLVSYTMGMVPVVILCIIVKEACTLTIKEISEFCELKLSNRDKPHHYVYFDEFPKGKGVRKKIAKNQLSSLAAEKLGLLTNK